jgi:magnesium-transporting ATPase (P-type)
MSCFNLLFTVDPPFIFVFWEQVLPQEVLLANAQLYRPEYDPMSFWQIVYTLSIGVYQSACAYFGARLLIPDGPIAENGTLSYLAVVATVVGQVIMWHNALNMWCFIFYAWQITFIVVMCTAWILFVDWNLMPVFDHAFRSPPIIVGWLVSVVAALVPGFLIESIKKRFWPSDIERFAETIHLSVGTGRRDEVSDPTGQLAVRDPSEMDQ